MPNVERIRTAIHESLSAIKTTMAEHTLTASDLDELTAAIELLEMADDRLAIVEERHI